MHPYLVAVLVVGIVVALMVACYAAGRERGESTSELDLLNRLRHDRDLRDLDARGEPLRGKVKRGPKFIFPACLGLLLGLAVLPALGQTNAVAKVAKLPRSITVKTGRVYEQVLLVERTGAVLRIRHVRGGSPQSTTVSRAELLEAEVPVWFPTNEAGKIVDFRASAEEQAKWAKEVRR